MKYIKLSALLKLLSILFHISYRSFKCWIAFQFTSDSSITTSWPRFQMVPLLIFQSCYNCAPYILTLCWSKNWWLSYIYFRSLDFNKITDLPLGAFNGLSNLQELYVWINRSLYYLWSNTHLYFANILSAIYRTINLLYWNPGFWTLWRQS